MVVEAFELVRPELDLHEGKYPVGYIVSDDQLREILAECGRD